MRKGKLVLIIGPMFAGKTTYLINQATKLGKEKVLIAKPRLDSRYSKKAIVNHNHIKLSAQVVNEKSKNDLIDLYNPKYEYLFLDEANFFSFSSLWPQLKFWLEKGKNVFLAGLEYDYRRQIFGPLHRLRQYADEVVQLYAVCDGCGGKATLSYRKKPRWGQVVVGGADLYGACCPKCYPKLNHLEED